MDQMIVCNAEFCAQQFHIDEENGKLKCKEQPKKQAEWLFLLSYTHPIIREGANVTLKELPTAREGEFDFPASFLFSIENHHLEIFENEKETRRRKKLWNEGVGPHPHRAFYTGLY